MSVAGIRKHFFAMIVEQNVHGRRDKSDDMIEEGDGVFYKAIVYTLCPFDGKDGSRYKGCYWSVP